MTAPLSDYHTRLRQRIANLERRQQQRRKLIDQQIADMETIYAAHQQEIENLRATTFQKDTR
jgi:hypothetical protein